MTPEEGTGDCIRTTGSMTWEAIWETFRAGAHVVGVGYLLARGMLLILLNDFLKECLYEKVSDVQESGVWFASKNLTPCRMH